VDVLIFQEGDEKLYEKVFLPHVLIISQFLDASMITDLPIIDDIATVAYSQG
jgi:hypothetical protein